MLLLLFCALLSLGEMTFAQSSTAPPTSLAVRPLSPDPVNPPGIESCALCRPLEGRPGSDLKRHRARRDHDLHPHKKAPGVGRSQKRSFKSLLPQRKLGENEEESER
jgi:hypothetical protein